jgi:N-acyl-L-homoserine lactone synthetase
MLSARKQLDIVTGYHVVGTYRGAAEICGVTHMTVRRIVNRAEASQQRTERRRNYESVRSLVATKIEDIKARISAKRLLPAARAAGYEGSDRNFRRLVAQERSMYRQGQAPESSRRPAV